MTEYRKAVPGDVTILPGMRTLFADRSQRGEVVYIRDVEYVRREEGPLHLQLLLPDGLRPGARSTLRYPLVVYVQGSAWGEQDVYFSLPKLVPLAQAGFVVASVKHRASTVAKFPAFLQDVKSAIRFLRAHADTYCIDPNQVGIWGDSSGGHAAQMVGVTGDMGEFKTSDNGEISDAVQAVVDFYGPSDVTHINDAPRDPQFTADKEHIPEDILFGGCGDCPARQPAQLHGEGQAPAALPHCPRGRGPHGALPPERPHRPETPGDGPHRGICEGGGRGPRHVPVDAGGDRPCHPPSKKPAPGAGERCGVFGG